MENFCAGAIKTQRIGSTARQADFIAEKVRGLLINNGFSV
jgi:hypothetical protein